jgi:hypothetical protein
MRMNIPWEIGNVKILNTACRTIFLAADYFLQSEQPVLAKPLMDKHQPTGQNLDRVFISRSGWHVCYALCCYEAKLPNLKVKNFARTTLRFSPARYCAPRF